MAVILSLSKDSGQRPLRASLRQAQTDRPTRLKIQYVMGRNEGSIRRLYRAKKHGEQQILHCVQDDKKFFFATTSWVGTKQRRADMYFIRSMKKLINQI